MAGKTATKKQETKKQEFKMEQAFAMWKKKLKSGKFYFTGKDHEGKYLVGFFNTMKKNPKEPDVRIYLQAKEGEEMQDYCSMWAHVSKNDKSYLSGKLDGKKVVGFINKDADEKHPYFSVYFSDSAPQPQAEAKPQEAEAEPEQEKLPF